MATPSVTPASQPLPDSLRRPALRPPQNNSAALRSASNTFCESDTYASPDARCARSRAMLGHKTVHRGRLGFIRAATRPCAALQVRWLRATGGVPTGLCKAARGQAAARNKAQAPAVGEIATPASLRERAKRAYRAMRTCSDSQIVFEAERSAAELICAGSRARPAQGIESGATALASDAVAIRDAACPRAALPAKQVRAMQRKRKPWIHASAGLLVG